MNRRVILSLSKGVLALSLAACQGSFGSGGTEAPGGMGPPINPQAAQQNPMNQSPPPGMSPSPSASAGPNGFVTLAFADASTGLQCPQDQGFSCTLRFNVPDDKPSKAGSKSAAKSSPSPSPSASPSASPPADQNDPNDPNGGLGPVIAPDASASPGASSSPSASSSPEASVGAHIMLASSALPKDAPPMVNPDPKAVATVALMKIRLKTDADEILQGKAIADFTLPKEQIGGRGFAVQLFRESVKKKKTSDDFVGTYNDSKIKDTTLQFQLAVPKLQVKKDETWLLVLYGDEMPSASTSPGASASPNASASPASIPSPGGSASPIASTHP